jgi:type I restriction enzyme S subunit
MSGEYPYYGPTGILDYLNEYRLEGEYALLGEDGDHFLKFAIWDMAQLVSGRFNVNNHAHIIKGKSGCLTEWVYFYFKHRDIAQYLTKQGAGRLKLTKAALERIPIPVPEVSLQERLIQLFRGCEASIASARKQLGLVQKLAKALRQKLLTPRDGLRCSTSSTPSSS